MSEHDTLRERLASAVHEYVGSDSTNDCVAAILPLIQAELAALREPMACGHPKACWVEGCDGDCTQPGCKGTPGHCLACKELAALRQELIESEEERDMNRRGIEEGLRREDYLRKALASRDETIAKLRESFKWAMACAENSVIFKSAYGDTICGECNTAIDRAGVKREHRQSCELVEARALLAEGDK